MEFLIPCEKITEYKNFLSEKMESSDYCLKHNENISYLTTFFNVFFAISQGVFIFSKRFSLLCRQTILRIKMFSLFKAYRDSY